MTAETIFRVAFWVLIAGVLVMRIFFTLQIRLAGERLMPDRQAVEREGRVMFAVRVLLGLILFGWLVAYTISPAWFILLSDRNAVRIHITEVQGAVMIFLS
jgi:hypothetical protein